MRQEQLIIALVFVVLITMLCVLVCFRHRNTKEKEVEEDVEDEIVNTDHWGYIHLKNKRHIAYELKGNNLSVHACEDISDLNGIDWLVTSGFDGNYYLLHSPIPFSFELPAFIQNTYGFQLDYVIKGYEEGSKYDEVRFRFDELQFFLPSKSLASKTAVDGVLFLCKPHIVKEFEIDLSGRHCIVQFVIDADSVYNGARAKAETYSEIRVHFDKTDDLSFLYSIYMLVDYAFAFICNRQNTTCTSMRLIGEYNGKVARKGEVIDKLRKIDSEMVFFDEYRESPENSKIIEEAAFIKGFFKHIDKLFEIIAEDITNPGFETSKISLGSVHPSIQRRKLIDLQQSLHITAAFEFYVKKYLPEMVEEKLHHVEVKEALTQFLNEQHSKKSKKIIKTFLNHIADVSLKDKIIKTYNGYCDWQALKPCISEEWFGSEEVDDLAEEANKWRNELAHEKREHDPSIETIHAIRLIEHMNYAIVLREIGYTDEEIQGLLDDALIR